MKSVFSWKLVPLAAIVALGLLVIVPGGINRPNLASAAFSCATTHTLTVNIIDDTTSAHITTAGSHVIIDPDPQNADAGSPGTRTYIDNGTNDDTPGTAGVISESAACSTTSGTTYSVTLDSLPAALSECSLVTDSVTRTLTANATANLHVDCPAGNITVSKVATGGTGSESFDFTVAAAGSHPCEGTFSLSNGGSQILTCDAATYTISEAAVSGWTASIACTPTGGLSSGSIVTGTNSVTIAIADSGQGANCTFTNTKGGGSTATITASAGPNSVGCSGSSFISLVLKDANNQPVADGTTVTVAASIGSVNPTSATTTAGGALILYTAPAASGGTATITATAGTATGSVTVAVNCQGAAPTATPAPVATAVIKAPSTGDAGLASSGGASLPAGIGLVLVVGTLLGGLAAMRVRA